MLAVPRALTLALGLSLFLFAAAGCDGAGGAADDADAASCSCDQDAGRVVVDSGPSDADAGGSDGGEPDGVEPDGGEPPLGPESCDDGLDNDRDGAIDCYDRDCDAAARCAIPGGQVMVEPGGFSMGSPLIEVGRRDDETLHQVLITYDYYIGTHEVTQGQFEAVMGFNPSTWSECGPDCPVDGLTWDQAATFTNALSEAAGLHGCYGCDPWETEEEWRNATCPTRFGRLSIGISYPCDGFRLPTEAEWERAARAGTDTAFPNGGDLTWEDYEPCNTILSNDQTVASLGWFCGSNPDQTMQPVGGKAANPWGLYDTVGNVSEWTDTPHEPYRDGTSWNPQTSPSDEAVVRGGHTPARLTRSAPRAVSRCPRETSCPTCWYGTSGCAWSAASIPSWRGGVSRVGWGSSIHRAVWSAPPVKRFRRCSSWTSRARDWASTGPRVTTRPRRCRWSMRSRSGRSPARPG